MPVEADDFEFHDISLDHLDRQWVEHPNKFREYAFGAVAAKRDFQVAKAALKVATAEAAVEIRKNPADWDVNKGTEKEIESAVNLHPKVSKAQQNLIDAEYRMGLFDAAVDTMHQRKGSLEALVELHGRHYFSEPRASSEASEGMEAHAKKAGYSKMKVTDPRKKKASDDD